MSVHVSSRVDVTKPQRTTTELRLAGLDSIRLWLALWVYFSHFGLLPFAAWIGKSTPLQQIASGVANNLFNGAGAVIGFFVISGLCIHFPHRRNEPISILRFYTRRYIRITVPLIVALALSLLIGNDLIAFYEAILWSLLAELIYYTLYPALRFFWRRFGWQTTFVISYSIAVGLIIRNPHFLNFHEFGPRLTWAVGLPSWLLGCYLAENWNAKEAPPALRIWRWRVLIWSLGSAASILRFHVGIGFPISLTLLGPVLYHWLRLELGHYVLRKSFPVFDWAGKFSYSIYLVHGLAVAVLGLVSSFFMIGGSTLVSLTRLGFVIALSYVFFRLVELPSHGLARWAARQLRN